MTTLHLDGTTPHGWLAALGAIRVLAQRWPQLLVRWSLDDGRLILDAGPSTTDEAAEAIRELTLDRIPDGGVLPDCPAEFPPPGRDWWGARGRHLAAQPPPAGSEMWASALLTPSRLLHPMVWPHAAQTVRGMLTTMVGCLRADPGLLDQAICGPGLGLTRDYPAGLWILRGESDTGSSASPGLDWLAVMGLPCQPARDVPAHQVAGAVDQDRPCRGAVGWHYRRTGADRSELVCDWLLWETPMPASAVPALLGIGWSGAGGFVSGRTARCGARRDPGKRQQDPPYLREVADGHLDDAVPLGVVEVAGILGIKATTLVGYVSRGQAPAYDAFVGGRRGWWPGTIWPWIHRDRQPGARTDLSDRQ
jgi:hypothetical protein